MINTYLKILNYLHSIILTEDAVIESLEADINKLEMRLQND